LQVLHVMYKNMVTRKGMSPARARDQLIRTDPFQQYTDLVMSLPDDPGDNV